jgi:quercetin dioxygenase-like cupin family protein
MTPTTLKASLLLVMLQMIAATSLSADEAPKPGAAVTPLATRDLAGVAGKEVVMLTVEYLPGGASMPHRHDATVHVYVLEGSMIMQVAGQEPVTLTAGQTFYESPGDVHTQSANASKTKPAKILVFMVKEKGAPATRPATP